MMLGVLFGAGGSMMGSFMGKALMMGASVAGSLLLRDKQQREPNKLNDLRVASASYNKGIPIVWGTMRVTANVFWSTDFREQMHYVGKKGKQNAKGVSKGKAQEVYEYFAFFAVGLCEGPVARINKIWADNNLIYSTDPKDKDDIVGPGFTQNQGQTPKGGKGKQDHGATQRFSFRPYMGEEDQMPDPYMVKTQGADKVPAHRGMCYIFFEDFPLQDFGNRIPTITAEVTTLHAYLRPDITYIENMNPKDAFRTKARGHYVICGARNRFYHEAIGHDGITYIRVFDIARRREIRRIPFRGSTSGEGLLTQKDRVAASGGDVRAVDQDGYILFQLRGTAPYVQWLGVDNQGNLLFYRGGNHNPTRAYDPDTLMQRYQFGRYSIFGQDGTPYGPRWAHPLAFLGKDYTNRTQWRTETLVHSINQINIINPLAPATDNLFHLNMPGGTSNVVQLSTDLNRRFYLHDDYLAPGALVFRDSDFNGENRPVLAYRFPPGNRPYNLGEQATIDYLAYCAPIDAMVAVGRLQSTIEGRPSGTYAVIFDKNTGEERWHARVGDAQMGWSGRFLTPSVPVSSGVTRWVSARHLMTVDWRNRTHRAETLRSVGGQASVADILPARTGGTPHYYYPDKDVCFYFAGGVEEGKWVWMSVFNSVPEDISLHTIVRDICIRAGIAPHRIDLSKLQSDDPIHGYMIEQPTSARAALEELSGPFQFDAVESDNVLKFVSRGQEAIMVIPQRDLGIVETDLGGENEYYVETRQQEIELPERVNVEYINHEKDYEIGGAHYARPLRPLPVISSQERVDVSLKMAMKGTEAKKLAMRILFAAWGERTSHEYGFGQDYLMLDPTDVVRVEFNDGQSFNDRLTDIEIGADYSMRVMAVSQVAHLYNLNTEQGIGGGRIPIPTLPAPPVFPAVFDIPYLNAADVTENAQFVYYTSIHAYAAGFRGGVVTCRFGFGDTSIEAFLGRESHWGTVEGPVPPPPHSCEITDVSTVLLLNQGYQWNEVAEGDEDFAEDMSPLWETIPDELWPNEDNMIIVEDEVILFKNVEEIEEGRYAISHLIRGYKGTTEAAFKHTQTAPIFALVPEGAIEDAAHDLEVIGTEGIYEASSPSRQPSFMTARTKTLTGASRKPFAVGGVKRVESGTSTTVSWRRATRYGGEMRGGTGNVPLNEEAEAYEVYFLNAPYNMETWDPENTALYWRKLEQAGTSTTINAATYSAAGKNQTQDLHVVIYQMSGVVGRGFIRALTLPYSRFGL